MFEFDVNLKSAQYLMEWLKSQGLALTDTRTPDGSVDNLLFSKILNACKLKDSLSLNVNF